MLNTVTTPGIRPSKPRSSMEWVATGQSKNRGSRPRVGVETELESETECSHVDAGDAPHPEPASTTQYGFVPTFSAHTGQKRIETSKMHISTRPQASEHTKDEVQSAREQKIQPQHADEHQRERRRMREFELAAKGRGKRHVACKSQGRLVSD